MDSTIYAGDLTDCVRPLDEQDRQALRRYWEQVISEEWTPAAEALPRAVSWEELDERRARRNARRAMARIAQAAGRRTVVVPIRGTEAA
jgi:hypothetical protein